MTRLLLKPFQRALAACLVAAVSFCLPQEAEAGFLIIFASSEDSAENALFAWGHEWSVSYALLRASRQGPRWPDGSRFGPTPVHSVFDGVGGRFPLYRLRYEIPDDLLITAGAPPRASDITLFADPAAVARYLDYLSTVEVYDRFVGIDPGLSPCMAAPGLPHTQYMQALLAAVPGVLDRRTSGRFVSQIPSGNGTYPLARALTAIVVEYLAFDLFLSIGMPRSSEAWDCPAVAEIYRALEQGILPAPGSPAVSLAIAAANATDPPFVHWHPAPRQAQPTQPQAAPARNQRDHYAARARRDDGKYGVQIPGGPVIPLALLPLQPPRAHRPSERGSGCSIQ